MNIKKKIKNFLYERKLKKKSKNFDYDPFKQWNNYCEVTKKQVKVVDVQNKHIVPIRKDTTGIVDFTKEQVAENIGLELLEQGLIKFTPSKDGMDGLIYLTGAIKVLDLRDSIKELDVIEGEEL